MNENISKALVKALSEIKNPERAGKANIHTSKGDYSYRYAQLPDILSAVRPILANHNLALIQNVKSENGNVSVNTVFLHESGETFESEWLSLPAGNTPQSVGSATTYARRYSLTAVLGIAGEDDDNGNEAEPQTPSHVRQERGGAPKTTGGASEKAVNYAKSLFVDAGVALGSPPDESDEKKQARRDNNKLAVSAWLKQEGWDVPENAEDPLEHFGWEDISTMIDMLKARAEKLNG